MAIGESGADEGIVSPDLGLRYLTDVVQIGRGGFAYVFAATDTRFDRRVAVKVFDQLLTDDDRILFENECRTTGRLSGVPNVITVHDIDFTADGRPCIVMAYIPGGSLGDQLRRSGLIPWRRAVRHMITILAALEEAHRRGVLHRDIKPENILIDGDRVYLTDFGLATVRSGADSPADPTATGIIASPLHAPPETFDGGVRDERSDVYSAGSTLYNLIAGHAPFQRHPDLTTAAIVERLRSQDPPDLPAGLAPPPLNALIQRTLAKDPATRPQSAGELADAFRSIVDSHAPPSPGPGAAGTPPPLSPRSAATLDVPVPAAPDAAPAPATSRTASARPGVAGAPSLPVTPPIAAPTPGAGGGSPAGAAVGRSPIPPQPASWAPSKRRLASAQPVARLPRRPSPAVTPAGPGRAATPGWVRVVVFLVAAVVLLIAVTSIDGPSDDVYGTDEGFAMPAEIANPAAPVRSTTTTPLTVVPVVEAALAAVAPFESGERRWADAREQVLIERALGGWLWDAESRTISGPGGMLVDLRACPTVWDPYEGVETDQIRLRQIASAEISPELDQAAAGTRAYLDYVNAHGGLSGSDGRTRRIALTSELDSGVVQQVLRAEDVEALATQTVTAGAIDNLAADLGSACVPDPFVPSSGAGWSDPAVEAWVWADRLSPEGEGRIVAAVVARLFPDPVPVSTLTAVVVDDEAGQAALQAVQRSVEAQGVAGVRPLVVEGGVGNTAAALDTLDAAPPDALLVLATRPQDCVRMARAVREHDLPSSIRFVVLGSACRHTSYVVPSAAGDTTWFALSGPHLGPGSNEEWTAWADEVLEAAGYPAPRALALYEGFASGWSLHQALLIADELPGGLSRPNLMLAARIMRMDHPGLVEDGSYGMYGYDDADPVEAAPVLRWNPVTGDWEPSDLGVIDVSRFPANCVRDEVTRQCT